MKSLRRDCGQYPWWPAGRGAIGQAMLLVGCGLLTQTLTGCGDTSAGKGAEPGQFRLQKIYQFYQDYTTQKKRPPPNEHAFKEFLHALPAEEKQAAGLSDDVDDFLTSPRDHAKYVIRYNTKPDTAANRAVIWEKNGVDGKRYVALSMGYVELYDDETIQGFQK